MDSLKIITGGQTGVDRAALDVALIFDIPCGGWCPSGRKAEDGIIPIQYPLIELPKSEYSERTRQNVTDSDGTLIIYFDRLYGGTEETLSTCLYQKKPFLLINGNQEPLESAVERLGLFIRDNAVLILNVAGPRASDEPQAYPYTLQLMKVLLRSIKKN